MEVGKSTEDKKKDVKKRHWAFILYPESAPSDWLEKLKMTGLPCAVSPVHDMDVNEDTGEVKKAHHHIIAAWSGPITRTNAQQLTESLNATLAIPLESIKGYYAYLWHNGQPEKHQYDKNEVVTLNGFNVNDFAELSRSEVHKMKIEIQKYIGKKDIYEYCQLLDELLADELLELHEIAANNTVLFNNYVRSRRHMAGKERSNG